MFYYLLSSTPCAVKLNGGYKGVASDNYSVIEASDALIELTPLDGSYSSVNFLVGENAKEQKNIKKFPLGGGELIIPVFDRKMFSDFKLIGRQKFDFFRYKTYLTCYAENGVRLILETASDMKAESVPFYPDNIFFEVVRGRNEYLIVFLVGKRTLTIGFKIDEKISLAFKRASDLYDFSGDVLTLTEYKTDVLKHTVKTVWKFDEEVKAIKREVIRRKQIYSLPDALFRYAFFEELMLGGDVKEFLRPKLYERIDNLKEFLGKYTAVLPPPHFKRQDLVILLYSDHIVYADAEVEKGLIQNVSLLDCDEA